MFSRKPDPDPAAAVDDDTELTPEQEQAWEEGLDRVRAEKRRALADPGPSWREWFLYDGAKWWMGLVFVIVDSWVVSAWIVGGAVTNLAIVGAVVSLIAALYLEVLFYRYLWRRPSDDDAGTHGRFRPSWKALREVGRWTPEAAQRRARAASGLAPVDGAPDPREFL